MTAESGIGPKRLSDADPLLAARARIVLGTAALLTLISDAHEPLQSATLALTVLSGYVAYGICMYVLCARNGEIGESKLPCWLDLGWFALIIFATGGARGLSFLLFSFAILNAAFRWGLNDGARVTLASAALYAVSAAASPLEATLMQYLSRSVLILTLGWLITRWGDAECKYRRRLVLLRSVSKVSNPRFGVDHTLDSLLEKLCVHFDAGSCVLVMRCSDGGPWTLRTASRYKTSAGAGAVPLAPELALPLLALPEQEMIAFTTRPRLFWTGLPKQCSCSSRSLQADACRNDCTHAALDIAELLDTRSFISAPLALRNGGGRLFVAADHETYALDDAEFLGELTREAFPMIENIALLDHLASGAALMERQRIARDLHDSTVQPYIGLKHGLHALRNRAAADNPLVGDIDRLLGMATQVISDLRKYAGSLAGSGARSESALVQALRRQTAHIKEFYGIDIAIVAAAELKVNDRLAGEVIQIVSEGLSNIRRHTHAVSGYVKLGHENNCLAIEIVNHHLPDAGPADAFFPRSIGERARALGGLAHVGYRPGVTAIQIEIPV